MRKQLKEKWVKALRSGEFKQGKDYLCAEQDDGTHAFCCLGVLACVMGKKPERLISKSHLNEVRMAKPSGLGSWGSGCYDNEDPETHYTTQRKLAAMNDNGDSFKQIANWISRNL